MPPDSFVTVAERTGLVGDLGRYALDRALAELAAIRRTGRDVGMSVNLSVRQLSDDDLVEQIAALLAQYDVPAPCVTMEVTEGVMLSATGRGWDALAEVRDLGVRIALDDFGTGYSQLPYLRRFDFDQIKIDQSFVATMDRRRPLAGVDRRHRRVRPSGRHERRRRGHRAARAGRATARARLHARAGLPVRCATRSPSGDGRRRPRPGPGAQPRVDHQRE